MYDFDFWFCLSMGPKSNQSPQRFIFHFYIILYITCLSLSAKLASLHVSLQQLRANIREMEKLCARVCAEDSTALEALVKPVRDRASAAAQDFLLLHSSTVSQPPQPPAAEPSSCVSSVCHGDDGVEEEPVSGRQIQLHLSEIPAEENAAESWENLEEV